MVRANTLTHQIPPLGTPACQHPRLFGHAVAMSAAFHDAALPRLFHHRPNTTWFVSNEPVGTVQLLFVQCPPPPCPWQIQEGAKTPPVGEFNTPSDSNCDRMRSRSEKKMAIWLVLQKARRLPIVPGGVHSKPMVSNRLCVP